MNDSMLQLSSRIAALGEWSQVDAKDNSMTQRRCTWHRSGIKLERYFVIFPTNRRKEQNTKFMSIHKANSQSAQGSQIKQLGGSECGKITSIVGSPPFRQPTTVQEHDLF